MTKEGIKVGKAACQSVLEKLTFSDDPDNMTQLRAELFSHFTCQGPISEETDRIVRDQIKEAQPGKVQRVDGRSC